MTVDRQELINELTEHCKDEAQKLYWIPYYIEAITNSQHRGLADLRPEVKMVFLTGGLSARKIGTLELLEEVEKALRINDNVKLEQIAEMHKWSGPYPKPEHTPISWKPPKFDFSKFTGENYLDVDFLVVVNEYECPPGKEGSFLNSPLKRLEGDFKHLCGRITNNISGYVGGRNGFYGFEVSIVTEKEFSNGLCAWSHGGLDKTHWKRDWTSSNYWESKIHPNFRHPHRLLGVPSHFMPNHYIVDVLLQQRGVLVYEAQNVDVDLQEFIDDYEKKKDHLNLPRTWDEYLSHAHHPPVDANLKELLNEHIKRQGQPRTLKEYLRETYQPYVEALKQHQELSTPYLDIADYLMAMASPF